jgi:ubiquinone/menaquinone biosynthesis C-methylase UbiE
MRDSFCPNCCPAGECWTQVAAQVPSRLVWPGRFFQGRSPASILPVTGIDIEESQFAKAREQAEQEGLNIEFQTANISHLPFGDGYFDAVFSHAVLQHLTDPDAALTELRRVLKPGGLIGVRAGDMGGTLVDSEGEEAAQGLAAYLAKSEKGGGDPYIGRKLGRLLRKAGFMVEGVSASYEVITETLRQIGPSLAAQFAVAEKERGSDAENDLPFVALAWCEAIGRVR